MLPTLLSTKYYAPLPGAGLVSRPRLLQMLQQGLQAKRKWTLVSAPAGYGKSTLIAEWLQQGGQAQTAPPFAWLSLDDKDNDPVRFLTYAIAALQKVYPDIGQYTLALLDSFQKPDPETLLTTLINEISAIASRVVFVLDDYHHIEAEAVHDLMRFLLDNLPDGLHPVLITRQDPPLPISRFRARGQVTEIRANQLRFTPEEAKQFFHGQGLQLQPGWIQTLEDRTEGWVVGLSLAALSMQGRENLENFFQSFSGTHRYILDYLFDEVMQQQPEVLRAFLSQTAILDRFCAPLCDALLNLTNSQALLAQIERANLFLIPLDDQRIWYRYHHLFADSLRAGLEKSQPQQMIELHRRAAAWFEHQNLADEAIQHALAAQDLDHVASLIEKYSLLVIFERNEPTTFNTWFASLTPEVVNRHPALLPAKAWSEIVLSNLKAGEYWFNQAIQAILPEGLTDEATRSILGDAYAAGATLGTLTGNSAMLTQYVRKALDLLPSKSLFMRCIAQWCLGQDYRHQVQIAKAERAFADAAQLSKAAGSRFFYLLALSNQGDRLFELGKLREAARVYQEIRQSSNLPRTLHPMAGEAFLHHSELLLEWNQLEAAHELVMEGFQLARQTGIKEIILNGYEFLARIHMAQQDIAGALTTIEEGIEYAEQYPVRYRLAQMKAWQAHLWLMATNRGKSPEYLPLALDWARAARPILDQPPDALQFITYLTLARADIIEQRYPECVEGLERLQQIADSRTLGYLWLKVQVLKGLLYERQGKHQKALASLNQALAKAKPEACIRVFLDGGPIIEKLLQQFSKEPAGAPFQDYLQTLLSGFKHEGIEPDQTAEKTAETLNPPAVQQLVEPLNERELEILRLMAQGLSNNEIATRLSLSTKTIKWHAYNLYAKLGVNSRTQAIASARERSLI